MELLYRLYGLVHRMAKMILGHNLIDNKYISFSNNLNLGISQKQGHIIWDNFISNSKIQSDSDYYGNHYAGYIAENKSWCLPSWIWTNAAIVRYYCISNQISKAINIANLLIKEQLDCGGWIVRNDYDNRGAVPMLAPNDSAYIANNAFISLYIVTKDEIYLNLARKCADWIIETSRPDGLVYIGYNMRDQKWIKNCVIVDVGFTGGLFARLYEITKEEKYKSYLHQFIKRYIELFFNPSKNGFCTSLDENNHQQGGMFGRGQAWALEGLIPAYQVLKDNDIKLVIQSTIENLIKVQFKNGGWSYNLTKPLMGEDCKGISVIAKNIMDWYQINPDEKLKKSAKQALEWCFRHTAINGEARGGIFSYCLEGAIVHHLYTSCAFVYASAYALELNKILNDE